MGSYLEIDGRATNSKTYTNILIEAIRDIDSRLYNEEFLKKNGKPLLQPEYYSDEDIGCGDWIIRKKGMALLVKYLKERVDDEEYCERKAFTNHEYFLSSLESEEEKKSYLENFAEDFSKDIKWCYDYTVDILANMVWTKQKSVIAHWV